MLGLIKSWEEWLIHEKKASHNTVSSYMSDLFSFLKFHFAFNTKIIGILENYYKIKLTECEDHPITFSELRPSHCRSWLSKRYNEGISHASNARAISALSNFFKFLNKYKDLDNPHMLTLKSPKVSKPLPKPVTEEEIKKLLTILQQKSTWVGKRDFFLICLLYGSGLRISEALSLKISDLNTSVIKVKGKGGKERIIPILPMVKQVFLNYLQHLPYPVDGNDVLFRGQNGQKLSRNSAANLVRKIRRENGLSEGVTPHAFRHSFATHLLSEGVGIRPIQQLMGHSNLSTTQNYTKVSPDDMLRKYRQFFS